MAITVKHTKVSTIPDGDDTSVVRPSDWNADHQLTGTIPVENGGTGAATLTGYVYGNGTSAMTAATTIPNTSITGLGTASTKDAGVANGVATLDGSGTVPVSQLPAAVLGALNYQGTWNASTNTPTLTSSVGTKGYYYVVSVAGSTNLNGITDWQVGDWAVYNGTTWQKVDNTDAGGDVVGPTSATDNAIARFDGTTGRVIQNSIVTVSDTGVVSGVIEENFTPVTAPAYAEGRVFYDSTAKTLCYYNDNNQMTVNIGQEEIVRVRNQTGATIPNGSVVYINGATGNTPTIALALATSFSTADIIGVTTTDIAKNGFGYATINGLVNGLDTSAFTEGDAVFLSATTPGAFTVTEPTRPNYSIQVGVILRANPSVGTLLVSVQIVSVETQHIIGTMAVDQGGTGQTSYTNGQLLIGNTTGNTLTKSTLTASTGISVSNGAGSITLTNTAPDQTVSITGAGTTSVTGTYPNFTVTSNDAYTGTVTSVAATAGTGISVTGSPITTSGTLNITNTAPDQTVVLTAGTGISTSGTYPNFTITNTAPSSGGTVTSVTATAPVASTGGTTPVISMPAATTSVSGYLTSTDWNTFNNKQPAGTYVTSVTATSPVTSTGGTTPVIAMPAATGSVNGYLTSTDWTTFNNKGSGTVTSVAALTLGTTGTDLSSTVANGTTTPVITLQVPTASATNRGALSSTDWTTFNNKAPSVTYTTNYVPFGQGTTTPALSANFTYVTGTGTLSAPVVNASNGIVVNSRTVATSYSIPSGSSATSAGPITISSGVSVTVPTGGKWVVL